MKKAIAVFMIFTLILSLVGCDAVQRKFTRKKKTSKRPRIFQLKKYDIKPSPELYEKHYAYYMGWSSEMLDRLGQNHKKDVRCIEELIGQLSAMQDLLNDEAAERLEKHIEEYGRVQDDIVNERLDRYNYAAPLMTLEREDRAIKRDFCVSRIKNCIKKEWTAEDIERLGVSAQGAQQEPAPQPVASSIAPAAQAPVPAPASPSPAPAASRGAADQAVKAPAPEDADEDAVPSDRVKSVVRL